MTLIFEIAGGIVLAVAMIALLVAFREALAVALISVIGLAAGAVGIAIFYGVCGGWENAALVAVVFGVMGGAAWLIEYLNSHEKYGPSFRAMGNAIVVCAALIIPASLLLFPSLVDMRSTGPYVILPIAVVFGMSVRFYYRYAIKRELKAARERAA